MRALTVPEFGGPDVLTIADRPEPEAAAGQVVVEVRAVGVNPVDTYVRAGSYALKPDLPYVPHGDAAGVVAEVGEGVGHLKEGDRVIVCGTVAGRLFGAAAGFAACEAADVFPLPEGVTFEQAAGVNVPYVTAFRALIDRGRLNGGDRVLVHGGTGGVGLAAVQTARAHGVTVYATAGTDAGLALLRGEGVDAAVGHGELAELPDRPTLIVEMLANENLAADLDAVADGGRVVVVGSRGQATIDPRRLMTTHASVTGMTYFDAGDAGIRRAMNAVTTGLARGDLRPRVAATYPLDDAAEAHRAVMRDGKNGQVVLTP